ncbi:MAG: Kae1-associated serine/threonine protein kinase [Candidatus Woesearchaeota archaeon]|nr:MAG: Kae1-associated serine/threonine protein kinase [Candidatus Woesearchaeota archaeon]
MKKLIAQGAEAKIYHSDDTILKDRIKKNYRIAKIDDKLRKTRTKAEARLLERVRRAGLKAPKVLEIKDNQLVIEYIDGEKFRDYLLRTKDYRIMKELGKLVLKLHRANVIHGDLTTSNILKQNEDIYFIDFGLSQFSEKIEDKAVDIHLFKECLKSKHYDIYEKSWKAFLEGYKNKDVLNRLKIVESRGRYK